MFSALVSQGRRIIDSELPNDVRARSVLTAIGSGERTNANIQRTARLDTTAVTRSLTVLRSAKRVIASDRPITTTGEGTRSPRHRIDDAYLRFWLRFVENGWGESAGTVIEPVVRDSLNLLAGRGDLPGLPNTRGDIVGS